MCQFDFSGDQINSTVALESKQILEAKIANSSDFELSSMNSSLSNDIR